MAFLLSDAFWEYFFGSLPALLIALGTLIATLRTKASVETKTDEIVSMAQRMGAVVIAREESRESTDDDPM
jgi:hypothetical protein